MTGGGGTVEAKETATALVVLRPEESRRLIGWGTAESPPVRRAAASGRLVVVGGSTTRHVARHLTGEDPGCERFAVGWIHEGRLGETPAAQRSGGPFLFNRGTVSRGWPAGLLEQFEAGDVYVKGANALDPAGNVGVLMGSPVGGTIGAAMAILHARGGALVIPVSLRKTIPSVAAACRLLGQGRVDRVMGGPVGLMPILAGTAAVITEIEAFRQLFEVTATLTAAGGVGESAGALVFHLAGSPQAVNRAWEACHRLRREVEAAGESGL
ncbi:MAG: hypothetical protein HQL51_00560 [Magnetococcales bacterium]|nr:hypothetical protein [Magnetococcales bacterium]